ncbi:MAG: ERF family protein [Planctomycetota bacterium]
MTDAPHTMAAPTERIARGMPPDPLFDDVTKAQSALLAALAKASKHFDRIGKDAEGKLTATDRFKYADIAAINKATRGAEGALADQGVVVMQPLMPSPLGEGWSRITTIIAGHGATMSFPYDLRLSQMADGVRAPSTPQKMGAVLTYMRRYLLQSALNLAGDADLDSMPQEQGKQKQAVPPVQVKPQQRAPRPQRKPPTNKPASRAPTKEEVEARKQHNADPNTRHGRITKPEVARPVVARPTVVTMASKPAPPPDEPPHPADQETAPDFSLRADGDTDMGDESEVTILLATQDQKDALKLQFKRVGIKKRSEIDSYINGVVPGASAVTILENSEHAQLVINSISEMADAS